MRLYEFFNKYVYEDKRHYVCRIWLNDNILIRGKCEDVYINISFIFDNVVIDSVKIEDNYKDIDIYLNIDSFVENYKLI